MEAISDQEDIGIQLECVECDEKLFLIYYKGEEELIDIKCSNCGRVITKK